MFLFVWWIVREIMKTLLIMYYSVHVSFCDQVLCLASIGGQKVKPHIKAILGTLWATPLARQFNFCGLKGKRKAMVSCWKFLKAAVTKYMHVTEMGRGMF